MASRLPDGECFESALGVFDLSTEDGRKRYRIAVEHRLRVEANHHSIYKVAHLTIGE